MRVMKDIQDYLTPFQVHKILDCTDNERDRMLILSLWRTGLRVSELLNVKPSDIIEFEDGTGILIVRGTKTEAAVRIVDLLPDFMKEIKSYIANENIKDKEKIFKITRQRAHQIIEKTAKKAGFSNVHAHMFRHSFASNVGNQGVDTSMDLMLLQKILGHKSLDITSIYLHFKHKKKIEMLKRCEW